MLRQQSSPPLALKSRNERSGQSLKPSEIVVLLPRNLSVEFGKRQTDAMGQQFPELVEFGHPYPAEGRSAAADPARALPPRLGVVGFLLGRSRNAALQVHPVPMPERRRRGPSAGPRFFATDRGDLRRRLTATLAVLRRNRARATGIRRHGRGMTCASGRSSAASARGI